MSHSSITVAIIDSGIDLSHKRFQNIDIHGFNVLDKNGKYEVNNDIQDNIGHGTAVASIILSHITNIKFICIKIFNNMNDFIDEKKLIFSLNFLRENYEFDIINLSLGVNYVLDNKLYEICKKITDESKIIISAFDNNGYISYPACYSNIIGVSSDDNIKKSSDYYYIENDYTNICAKGRVQRLAWLNNSFIFCGGSSFAAAHITGIVANDFEKGDNWLKINKKLRNSAKLIVKEPRKIKNESNIINLIKNKKVAIFPFNKEMHALIRFPELLNFKITEIYDSKYSCKIGSSVNKLLDITKNNDYIIKNIDDLECDNFDVLIIGHCDKLLNDIGYESKIKDILTKVSSKNKIIFSFDDFSSIFNNTNKNIISPQSYEKDIKYNFQGRLHFIKTPILGIFGTSSAQGKFTLQLELRKRFLSSGYKVGQLGTEPTALLFNMDDCFHFGYNSTTDLYRHSIVQKVNNSFSKMDTNGCDIIICGCQGGFLTRNFSKLNDFSFSQLEFLLSTNPDIIILCCNIFDDISIIKKTINSIEGLIDTIVIGIVLFPVNRVNYELGLFSKTRKATLDEISSFKNLMEHEVGIKVYNLERDMDILYKDIINFLSK